MPQKDKRVPLYLDLAPESDTFLEDILAGLTSSPKTLPSKYFYDKRGSELFDKICQLEEYYLTRTEVKILEENLDEIVDALGESVILVEYGSGSSMKTRLLLDAIPDVRAYAPIDISREHLLKASEHVKQLYPTVDVLPVCADYSDTIHLRLEPTPETRLSVFFPGSTIGNFLPEHAIAFMRGVASLVGPGGGLLIGIDLRKDVEVIEAAYNDARGITAAFNKNVIRHINQRTEAELDPEAFAHTAPFNSAKSRIEMRLRALRDMSARLNGETIRVCKGEEILTEYSHKYSLDDFSSLAYQAGFETARVWTDDREYFSVQYLRVRDS